MLSFKQKVGLWLHKRLKQNLSDEHPLRQLFWECTLRCNAACLHCGSDCRVSASEKDMPLNDFLKVIDSLEGHVQRQQCLIILTGGEPLMRKDIEICGKELYDRQHPWGIVSNGLLFPKRFNGLMQSGLRSATISLDGFESEHNWLRGVPNAFPFATESIKLLSTVSDQVNWDVVTCVSKRNINKLQSLRDYLWSIGLRQWRLFSIFPVGRAAQTPDLQLSDNEFVSLMDFIADCRKNGLNVSYGCEGFLGKYEAKVRDGFYTCYAGLSTASILSGGYISGCTSIRSKFYQGNIYQDDFWTVWTTQFQKYRNRDWAKKDQCADCKMFQHCQGNGMHLYDENENLLLCHYNRIQNASKTRK